MIYETQSAAIQLSAALGSVPYLNARPLTHCIASPIQLLEPSRLSAELIKGKLDVGLVPVMEVLENADHYVIVDRVAIGTLKEVYSVFLTHQVPLERVRTVRLDPASRTSVNLARVLLEVFHNICPEYLTEPGTQVADAEVLIGDPAIAYREMHPEGRYLDLGAEWHRWTALPFVFAVWAIRREALQRSPELPEQLREAARLGLAQRGKIATSPFELCYLTEHLHYDLGPDQREAIRYFAENLAKLGKLSKIPYLEYV